MSDPSTRRAAGAARDGGVFGRFVHPRLAAVAAAGAAVWALSFAVAAAGVGLRETGAYGLAASLFFASGLLGLLGMAVLGAAGVYLLGLFARRWLTRAG